MAFQYQHQYQYGYQVQPGFQTYSSFFQMIHDIPAGIAILSVFFGVLPLLMLWGKPYLVSFLQRVLPIFSRYFKYKENREEDKKVIKEYSRLLDKRIEFRNIFNFGGYFCIGLLGFLIVSKMLFFGLVLSESMQPTLYPSDLVLIEALSKDIKAGDIIMFRPPNEPNPVIHRAISVNGAIRTKGDAAAPDDWSITRENIMGKAVMVGGKPVVIKNIGWYFMPIKTYIPGSDPMFEFIRELVQFIHTYGAAIVIIILLFAVIDMFENNRNSAV